MSETVAQRLAAALRTTAQAYAAGDAQHAAEFIDEVGQSVEIAETSLQETHKNPIKSPKHFKYAEMKTVDLL